MPALGRSFLPGEDAPGRSRVVLLSDALWRGRYPGSLTAIEEDFARAMASKSPVALRMAKSAVRAAAEMPLAAGIAYETELFVTCFTSDDKREGVAAFLEKRPAEFTGR